jgi:ABC-type polar amino acid transport system ATPase subunit
MFNQFIEVTKNKRRTKNKMSDNNVEVEQQIKKKRNKDRFVFNQFTIYHNLCAMKGIVCSCDDEC